MLARSTFVAVTIAFTQQINAAQPSLSEASSAVITTTATEQRRALFNYQMFCQGCHVADGSGHKSVPQLKGFMHNFMASQQGREYLIRVPGVANSALNDAELAEVMNWMLREFGAPSDKQVWQPYNAKEVGEYRERPLNETVRYRENLIVSLLATQ